MFSWPWRERMVFSNNGQVHEGVGSAGLARTISRAPSSQIFAPSTSLWVMRIVRGQPWEGESRTQ